MLNGLAVALLLAACALVTTGVQAQEGPPEEACFLPHSPAHQVFGDLSQAECALARQGWELVWYYPPGVYQAWCFATGDCPCPHCPVGDAVATRW